MINLDKIRKYHTGSKFILKALAGVAANAVTPAPIPEWYTKQYKYIENPGYQRRKPEEYRVNETLTLRRDGFTASDLSSAYKVNLDYIASDTQRLNDLNFYANSFDDWTDAESFVNSYNTNAAKIRGYWDTGHKIGDSSDETLAHNQLHKRMFRSLTDANSGTYIGSDTTEAIEREHNESTWHRRMDTYEKEFDLLSAEERASRIFTIKGKDGQDFKVYKKANGDIALYNDKDFSDNTDINDENGVIADPQANTIDDSWLDADKKDPLKTAYDKINNPTNFANILEGARMYMGLRTNNKVALRALDAEKPLLVDSIDHHRSIYGNLRAKLDAEKAAAQLNSQASRPMTSDGALQAAAQMEAAVKGNELILLGNAQDDAMIRQTSEQAWLQEKENAERRHAAAMQNRQAILESEKNKATILNARDSGNYSQVIAPYMMGIEQRLRNKGTQLEAYQEYYDELLADMKTWYRPPFKMNDAERKLRDEYLLNPSKFLEKIITKEREADYETWQLLSLKMKMASMQSLALKKGVDTSGWPNFTQNKPETTNKYNKGPKVVANPTKKPDELKDGGTIYAAKLRKRRGDNDRGSRAIQKSKDLSAKFLLNSFDSMYNYADLVSGNKKKKKKYLAGGGLPLVNFQPVFATSEKGAGISGVNSKAAAKAEKDKGLTDDDVLKLLTSVDGLPSDILQIIAGMKQFSIMDSMDPLKLGGTSSIASRYLNVIGQIKMANFNRKEYDLAYSEVSKNGGINEVAINERGLLYCMNSEGKFKLMTVDELKEAKGWQALTNSELLYMRANSPDIAFKNDVLSVVKNGIGIETVTKMILSAISGLGSSQTTSSGYLARQAGQLMQGFEILKEAGDKALLDGLYDGTIQDLYKYKYMNKNLQQQALAALNYIYKVLPENARTLLKLKSDGTDKGVFDLINSLIQGRISSVQESTVDLVGGKTKVDETMRTKKAEKVAEDDMKVNLAMNAVLGNGYETIFEINPGTRTALRVTSTEVPVMGGSGNAPLDELSIKGLVTSELGTVLDFSNVTMGGLEIDRNAFNLVTLQDAKAHIMDVPLDLDALSQGIKRPDFELCKKLDGLRGELSKAKTPQEKNALLQLAGLPVAYGANGELSSNSWARFAVFNGTAPNKAFRGEDLEFNDYFRELSGDLEEAALANLKAVNKWSDKDKSFEFSGGFLGLFKDYFYESTIWIPMHDSFNNASAGINMKADDVRRLTEQDAQMRAKEQWNYGGSLE